MGFFWSWFLIGTVAGLVHWYMTAQAHLDEVIDDEEADYMFKLTVLIILCGPLSVAYMVYVFFSGGDDE